MAKKFNKALKPQTTLAKEDAALTVANRKVYPGWTSDARRFGIRVADYNAGFIAGDDNRRRKTRQKSK